MAGTSGAALLPAGLRGAVEAAAASSQEAWLQLVAANREVAEGRAGLPLAMKYVPVGFAATYLAANSGLYIGGGNYTWGCGVYVTGVLEPLSTAIYGRAGVVARFDPAGWRCFDARDPANEALYLQWLHAQVVYPEAVLTVHSGYWLHQLRNHFREQFQIDVVMFRPDEKDVMGWYTRPGDTWLVVSDWSAGQLLAAGYSARFFDARMTVLVED